MTITGLKLIIWRLIPPSRNRISREGHNTVARLLLKAFWRYLMLKLLCGLWQKPLPLLLMPFPQRTYVKTLAAGLGCQRRLEWLAKNMDFWRVRPSNSPKNWRKTLQLSTSESFTVNKLSWALGYLYDTLKTSWGHFNCFEAWR